MPNDLMKALAEANSELANVAKTGKVSDLIAHPAFKKLNDAVSKIKKGEEVAWNAGCVNAGCSSAQDKLGKVSNPVIGQ